MNANPRVRLTVLGVVVLSLFAALFTRLWYLQILSSDDLQRQAAQNQQRVIVEQAPRGRILDRNGTVVVDNRLSIVVTVDRQALPEAGSDERTSLLARLADELTRYTGRQRSIDDIEARLIDPRYSPYTPVPVATDVPKELEVYLSEHRREFSDAVAVTSETIRAYPFGRLAAHVLGYVGSITQEELDARVESEKPYTLDDEIGKSGIERAYEDNLRGTPGRLVLEVDSQGRTVRQLSYSPPVPGDDVVLSLDATVQAVSEKVLVEELQNARDRRNSDGSYNSSPAGSVVILDSTTGEVVTMASYPDFDPGEFTKPIPTDRWTQLNDPSGYYLLNNRALQGLYPPASTFKLISAVAALRSGAMAPETTVADGGVFRVPGCRGEQCTFRNAGGTAHGYVNLPRALTVSSDVYFYTLGARFWNERTQFGDPIQQVAEDLGFGAPSGIPLPGEQSGYVPTPEKKKQRHDENPEAFPFGDWFTGDNLNLAIGQGDTVVTPLQLANAYAAFANGGSLFSPNVVREIRHSRSRGTTTISPRVLRQVVLPPEMRDPILLGLQGVTEQAAGTAYYAFQGFPFWRVAGKTGTAEVTRGSDTALFVGITPSDAPHYVGAAVLENSGFGAVAAAPVIRRVFEVLADPANAPTLVPGVGLAEPLPEGIDTDTVRVQD